MTAPPIRMRAPSPTDADLLTRYRQGDHLAFEALYDRYKDRLNGYAARMLGRVQEAEDVTTETFVRLVDGRIDVAGQTSLRALLFTVAHRLCLDRLRSWQRRDRILGWLARRPPPTVAPTVEDRLVRDQRDARLQAAIQQLAPRYRSVLLLTYGEGLSSQEAAAILGWTDQQVRSKLAYARRLLRDGLGDTDD